jgi:hypothetical protein
MMNLIPNCSEATFRLDPKGLGADERQIVKNMFVKAGDAWKDNETVDLLVDHVFGKEILYWDGDYPYNGGDKIKAAMEKAEKRLGKKLNWEIVNER